MGLIICLTVFVFLVWAGIHLIGSSFDEDICQDCRNLWVSRYLSDSYMLGINNMDNIVCESCKKRLKID